MAMKRKDSTSTSKNLKLKLYLNFDQVAMIERDRQNAKFVWNICLEQRQDYYSKKIRLRDLGNEPMPVKLPKAKKKKGEKAEEPKPKKDLKEKDPFREGYDAPYHYGQMRELTEIKKLCPFYLGKDGQRKIDLNETNSAVLNGVIVALHNAYTIFYSNLINNPTGAGVPRFKNKDSNISLKYKPFVSAHFKKEGKNVKIKLPSIGWVKARGKFDLEGGQVKTAAITKECGEYFVTLCVEVPFRMRVHPEPASLVGLDMGVVTTITTSDDEAIKMPPHLKLLYAKIGRMKRLLRKKTLHSKNYKKAYARIAKVEKYITRQKHSFMHAESTRLARKYGRIVMEDLAVKNMTKSAKGTKEKHGKNVAAKRGLNREILRNSLGAFRTKIEEKTKKFGGQFILIDPKYTSQKCSNCGTIDKESRLTQAKFVCTSCGYEANADVNAAVNIREKGRFIVLETGDKKV